MVDETQKDYHKGRAWARKKCSKMHTLSNKISTVSPRAVLQNLPSTVIPRRPHHTPARMRARPAQIKPPHRSAIPRPPRHRPHDEHLIQTHFAMKDVPPGNPKAPFQVQRTEHLPVDDNIPEIRSIFRDNVEHAIGEGLPQFIPGGPLQAVGSVLET